jgi:uncharacterized membrane protein
MSDLIAMASPDEAVARRAPARLADAVEKALVDIADVSVIACDDDARIFRIPRAVGRLDAPRPGGGMAGGLIGRDLVAYLWCGPGVEVT